VDAFSLFGFLFICTIYKQNVLQKGHAGRYIHTQIILYTHKYIRIQTHTHTNAKDFLYLYITFTKL